MSTQDVALMETIHVLRIAVVSLGVIFPAVITECSGPEVVKLFSCSPQLRLKFQLLINVKIVKISGKFRLKK